LVVGAEVEVEVEVEVEITGKLEGFGWSQGSGFTVPIVSA
jgi:hypothetical protein